MITYSEWLPMESHGMVRRTIHCSECEHPSTTMITTSLSTLIDRPDALEVVRKIYAVNRDHAIHAGCNHLSELPPWEENQ